MQMSFKSGNSLSKLSFPLKVLLLLNQSRTAFKLIARVFQIPFIAHFIDKLAQAQTHTHDFDSKD